MKKEKKYFDRQYIPIIIGAIILILLIGSLVYIITTDKDIKLGGSKTTIQKEFDHEEIEVDTGSSSCNKDTLNSYIKMANNIGISYQVVEVNNGPAYDEDGNKLDFDNIDEHIQIDITNVPSELRFEITNEKNDNVIKLNGKDAKDKTVSFLKEYSFYLYRHTIAIYANDDCAKTPIRKISIQAPVLNNFTNYIVCNENSKLYKTEYCDKVWYGKEYTYEDFDTAFSDEDFQMIMDKELEKELKKYSFYNKNKKYIIGGIILIIIILAGVILVIIKKRGKKNEI